MALTRNPGAIIDNFKSFVKYGDDIADSAIRGIDNLLPRNTSEIPVLVEGFARETLEQTDEFIDFWGNRGVQRLRDVAPGLGLASDDLFKHFLESRSNISSQTRSYQPGARADEKLLLNKNINTKKADNLTEWRRTINRNDIATERYKFLGKDMVKIDKGTWRSIDGKRQFRVVPADYFGRHPIGANRVPNVPHVHFEFLQPPTGGGKRFKSIKNIHVPLK